MGSETVGAAVEATAVGRGDPLDLVKGRVSRVSLHNMGHVAIAPLEILVPP